jgi:hypothetical protein
MTSPKHPVGERTEKMSDDLMSKVDHAAEAHVFNTQPSRFPGEHGQYARDCFEAGAQFVLTELSRVTKGHGPPLIKHDFVRGKTLVPMSASQAISDTLEVNSMGAFGIVEYAPLTELLSANVRLSSAEAEIKRLREGLESIVKDNGNGDWEEEAMRMFGVAKQLLAGTPTPPEPPIERGCE